ncbi:YggS family pyridoxal phosphate-dependent enzyme [Thiorhodococcus minor]|uniref:Pyridoxal phosphate homeostasis protein n=1 Tax=Thiorhodococcus minor TaxID=57489 RepID=A0A6M0JVN0_9GAMM|nr:YggS family pyridoxal phosphate-dependent enzyme [Thiorhodococcus minor]NEV61568.1 YggS family pyridoxal phosphate-dependent enzyme [Thiorhodococcus minor]
MMDGSVASRLEQVLERIRNAAARAERSPEEIALIAVSKKQPAEAIRAAYAAGQVIFGESYVQEGLDKIDALQDLDIEWHFIGRIQSNKTRQIAASFAWVHGLSELGHARRLSDQRPADAPPLNVCLQVNLSGESTKAGVDPADLPDLLAACTALPRLRVRGLMTLPAPADDEASQREPFAALRGLRDQLASPAQPLPCLSMGMSDDLEAAILEGATQVRIGTAVFGPRPYN